MNRIDRISAILIHLQSKRIVKAADIAERFDISLRTVYRDIRTLEEAGVPIVGEAGVGYSILKGYHLPPVVFTENEAIALLTAYKLSTQLTDDETELNGSSAMYKIKSVLESSNQENIDDLEHKIAVLSNPHIPKFNYNNSINLLTKATLKKNKVEILYTSNHSLEENLRTIQPLGIWFQSGRWHLMAYCELRKDYRNFRLDRIQELKVLKEIYTSKHPELSKLIQKTVKSNPKIVIKLLIEKGAYRHVGDQKYFMGFVAQKELKDAIEMTFSSQSLEGMARWIMMFGATIEIVHPLELRTMICKYSEALIEKNKPY